MIKTKKKNDITPCPHTPNPSDLVESAPCQEEKNILWRRDFPATTLALLDTIPAYPETKNDLDYALLPTGAVVRLKPSDYKERDNKEYPDAIPLIWEEWLYGPDAAGIATLAIGEAVVIVATGLKGNGKSETLAYLSAKALALDMPVWSNMGVKFWLVCSDGTLKLCETKDLDWSAVLLLTKELEKGALVVDELSYFASSRLSSSVRNRIINAAVNQVRKRTLDFYCSVKFLRQIDINIREELDAHFTCEDVAKYPSGQIASLPKGCYIKWLIRDISGWSGARNDKLESLGFNSLGEPVYANEGTEKLASLRFTWPIYDSYEVAETAEVFRKVRLDLEETVISDKPQTAEVEDLLGSVIDYFHERGESAIKTEDLREAVASAGLKLNEKQLGKILKDSFGVTRQRHHRDNYYVLGEEE